MGKSISELYNEMKGIKPVAATTPTASPRIPGEVPQIPAEMLESIKHVNDPVVAAYMTEAKKKKSAKEMDKVKLGVKTPIDLNPTTDDNSPDVKKIKEGFLGSLAKATAGAVGGVGVGVLGTRPTHNSLVIDALRAMVGHHEKNKAQAQAKVKAKAPKKKKKAKPDAMSVPVGPPQPKEKKKTAAQIAATNAFHNWLMNDTGRKPLGRLKKRKTMETTIVKNLGKMVVEKREINPQVKYGGPWRDSVNNITKMGLDIGSMQIKHLASTGKNRVFLAKALEKAKKVRDKAIEAHKTKFPIKEDVTQVKAIGTKVVNEDADTPMTEARLFAILDRLALFGFYPAGPWPSPEERRELASFNEQTHIMIKKAAKKASCHETENDK